MCSGRCAAIWRRSGRISKRVATETLRNVGRWLEAMSELGDARDLYEQDRSSLVADIEAFHQSVATNPLATNDQQHAARQAFDPIAEKIKGLIKQVDLLYKLASRATELAGDLASELPHLPAFVPSPSGRGSG